MKYITLTSRKAYTYVMNTQSDIAIVQHLRDDALCFYVTYEEATFLHISMYDEMLNIIRLDENVYDVVLDGTFIGQYNLNIEGSYTEVCEFKLKDFLSRISIYAGIANSFYTNVKKL